MNNQKQLMDFTKFQNKESSPFALDWAVLYETDKALASKDLYDQFITIIGDI